MRLSSILDPRRVVLDVGTGSKHDVLARLADAISASRPDLDRAAILAELERRETESSTAIADGIAIPHARPQISEPIAAFGRSKNGTDFDSLDGRPTTLLFVLLSPLGSSSVHVAWLAHIARVLSDASTRLRLLHGETQGQILDILREREMDIEAAAAAPARKDAQ